jgi:putative endonuclease
MEQQFYFTYVLFSLRDHKLYIGYTSQLESRLIQHHEGLNKSTKHRRPLKLIYFEGHISKASALKRENYFKTSAGKRTLKIMLGDTLEELDYSHL